VHDGDFAHLAAQHMLGTGEAIPNVVRELAGAAEPELVWRNELGGLTFRFADRFVKWNPTSTGIDLNQ
jgi:kanamycin kinase